MFEVNDIVVCVDVEPSSNHPYSIEACDRLTKRKMYRVQACGLNHVGEPSIDVGVKNSDIQPIFQNLYQNFRFRKLEKANIDIFALATVKPKVSEPA
jgi:hypothetical protein